MNSFDELKSLTADFCELDSKAVERLKIYAELLTEWNEKINLTAITDFEGILEKHFYDCLLFLKNIKIPENASVIDVGTGAGFPGVVLKIARPDINLTLLDGLNKRLLFLNELTNKLDLPSKTVHMRAEEAGQNPLYREQFDIATARAVARLNTLSEYCLPFVKEGGVFVAMKGPTAPEEINEAYTAIKTLGGAKPQIFGEVLPDKSERNFCEIKKISQTPTKYPRPHAKMIKKPL